MKKQLGSLRRGANMKAKQGYDKNLSKTVEIGNEYRLFFRTAEVDGIRDIVIGIAAGRSTDYDVCGCSFIRLDNGFIEEDEHGKDKDISGLDSWAKICKVFYNAQATREKKAKEVEAESTAKALGQELDVKGLSKALEAIDLEYFGGEAADGTKILAKKRPILSKLQYKFTTQALVVRLKEDGTPDWKGAKTATVEISDKRSKQLMVLLDNKNYCDKNCDWLEVGYNYIGTSKQDAGKDAVFQGIAKSVSLKEEYSELWEKEGKDKVDSIIKASTVEEAAELMISKNISLSGNVTPKEIVSSIKKWCATNAAVLTCIDFDADDTKYSIDAIFGTDIISSFPNSIRDKFMDLKSRLDIDKGITEDSSSSDEDAIIEEGQKAINSGENTLAALMNEVNSFDNLSGELEEM